MLYPESSSASIMFSPKSDNAYISVMSRLIWKQDWLWMDSDIRLVFLGLLYWKESMHEMVYIHIIKPYTNLLHNCSGIRFFFDSKSLMCQFNSESDINKTLSSVSNSSLSKTFALCVIFQPFSIPPSDRFWWGVVLVLVLVVTGVKQSQL